VLYLTDLVVLEGRGGSGLCVGGGESVGVCVVQMGIFLFTVYFCFSDEGEHRAWML